MKPGHSPTPVDGKDDFRRLPQTAQTLDACVIVAPAAALASPAKG